MNFIDKIETKLGSTLVSLIAKGGLKPQRNKMILNGKRMHQNVNKVYISYTSNEFMDSMNNIRFSIFIDEI